MKRPKVRLSRLRDIGWRLWDPIGLLANAASWETCGFEDEYDGYLMRAATMVRDGEAASVVVDYLIWAEIENMGLSLSPDARERAEAVVKAIQSDEQIWSNLS
ncbi:hypothetical protein HPO_03534 [Hyphomonas polymorpha PS728]|uniref:Uncharacterized protein n=1 Tax=Hyphomonas polymorpha PS728 TaxID=1280954 RepID=A0A062VJX2_9PROT|nr:MULTISPECIES: hypothetical protein [Hyphomonas]AXE63794.1 hypothetical protein BBF93_05840 [Hyphomonas sp. CACIAM 19H1]KCZ99932.1 hypothetical protein HPO_03534 [Hyphomonas polymorpha PS728]